MSEPQHLGPPPPPRPFLLDGHLWHPVSYLLGLFAGVGLIIAACGFLAPTLFWFGMPIALVFGPWTAWALLTSPVGREWYTRYARRRSARQRCLVLAAERRSLARGLEGRDERSRGEVQQTLQACRELADEYADTLVKMTAAAKRDAYDHHLSRRIPVGEIPNIADGRVRQLANHGVQRAADISHARVMSVPGFNEILTFSLMEWRRKVEREFRFDPTRAIDPAEANRVATDFHSRQAELLATANEAVRKLTALRAEVATTSQNLRRREAPAFADLRQCEADYRETDTLGPAKFGTLIATTGFVTGFLTLSLAWGILAISRAMPGREVVARPPVAATPAVSHPASDLPAVNTLAKRTPETRTPPTSVPREPVAVPSPQPEVPPIDRDDRTAGSARGPDGWGPVAHDAKPAPRGGSSPSPKPAPPVAFVVGPRAGKPAVFASGPELIARYERLLTNRETNVADGLVAGNFVVLVSEPVEVTIHSKSPAGLYVRVQSGSLSGRVFAVDPWFVRPTP